MQKRKNHLALAKTYIFNTNGTNELHKYSQAIRSKIKKLYVLYSFFILC
ncbi:protein of unknown function [Chryseobacterium sp. JV274]|nr:protein of unknown function [Chryseobacterium sp. JV274]